MKLSEQFNAEIKSIETRFTGGLSNTSTKKFDDLIKIVSKIIGISEDKIYITAATSRASNLWNRLAQGKPLTQHFSVALGIIDAADLQGGISPASRFIGAGVGHYDAIALAVKRNDTWVIGAVLDSNVLSIYDKIQEVFMDVDIAHEIKDIDEEEEPDEAGVLFAWYVGTTGNDNDGVWHDYSDGYIEKGIWVNGWDDKFTDIVKSIKVGDRIALKSCFTQKHNIPFNNHGKIVGAMKIKAIGVVIENTGDGKNIKVEWKKLNPVKTWYGPGTLRETIHGINASDGYVKQQLLAFTFGDEEQDYSLCEERYREDTDIVVGDEIEDGTGDNSTVETLSLVVDESLRLTDGCNVLLYGVPGSGKSWTIEHEYCKKDTNVERLVFHPDYTYSDFIGQILPSVDLEKQVSYRFTPGPFTNILKEAYVHPTEEYVLIIEEINRGNAPAIFGEVFQLLDRKVEKREGDDGYPIGTSEYGITNANIAKIVYKNPEHKVRIPSNLSIIGTMNTSDQNVFTLDTAFQRRWEMRLIENTFETVDRGLADAPILDTGISWEIFCTEINNSIVENNVRMTSSEDKRLGTYFVRVKDLIKDPKMGNLSSGEYDDLRKKESAGTITPEEDERLAEIRIAMKQNRRFPEKVIKYLWDDAFKFNREVIFETTKYRSLESVIRAFMYAEGIYRFKMFKQNVIDALQNPESEQ